MLCFYLLQCSIDSVLQGVLVFGIMNLKFYNNRIFIAIIYDRIFIAIIYDCVKTVVCCGVRCSAGFQHDIVSAESAFTVGSNCILSGQIYNQPQYKTMIKSFRLGVFGRFVSGVKVTEGCQRDVM